jgi:hypothetical protein
MKPQKESLLRDGFRSSACQGACTRERLHRRRRPAGPWAVRGSSIVLLLGLVLPLAGCGPEDFLNPLYTDKDLVLDPFLAGRWVQKGDDGTVILDFQPAQNGCYALIYTGLPSDNSKADAGGDRDPRRMKFDACLTQLGQTLFLDLQPEEIPVGATAERLQLALSHDLREGNLFSPAVFHTNDGLFITLTPKRDGDASAAAPEYELRLSPAHWIFRIWTGESTLRLSDFEPPGDAATLSTQELQKLALQYADDSDAFSSPGEWQRRNGDSR